MKRLEKEGKIRPSNAEYASPIVLVKKKNGEWRLCVDYRMLNKYMLGDNYSLSIIEDQLNVLDGKAIFSLLDLKDGFSHMKVAEDSIKYTAFVTPLGPYEFVCMPFSLKIAPSVFQRFVNNVLRELIDSGDVVVYMDDILVATTTLEHHLKVLKKLFKIFVENKLELRLDKCKFLYNKIEFLGYDIEKRGVSPTRR